MEWPGAGLSSAQQRQRSQAEEGKQVTESHGSRLHESHEPAGAGRETSGPKRLVTRGASGRQRSLPPPTFLHAMSAHTNTFPKLHNAMWPGLVGKGPDSEPPFDLDTMLDFTAKAEVDGVKFDGVDIFLFDPHISIDISDDDLKRTAEKIAARGFVVGSVVAPVWPPTGGGSAMGTEEERGRFVEQVRKACRIAKRLRELGVRPYGVIRIDSAAGVHDWDADPAGGTAKIAETFRRACDVAEEHGERLAAEGEICWGAHALVARDGAAAGGGGPPADARLPGGYGAHAPLHARLQSRAGPHRAGVL